MFSSALDLFGLCFPNPHSGERSQLQQGGIWTPRCSHKRSLYLVFLILLLLEQCWGLHVHHLAFKSRSTVDLNLERNNARSGVDSSSGTGVLPPKDAQIDLTVMKLKELVFDTETQNYEPVNIKYDFGKVVTYPAGLVLYHGTPVDIPLDKGFYYQAMWFSPRFDNSFLHGIHEVQKNNGDPKKPQLKQFYVFTFHTRRPVDLLILPPNGELISKIVDEISGGFLSEYSVRRNQKPKGYPPAPIMADTSDKPIEMTRTSSFCKNAGGWRSPWDQNEIMLCPDRLQSTSAVSGLWIKQKWTCDFDTICAEYGRLVDSQSWTKKLKETIQTIVSLGCKEPIVAQVENTNKFSVLEQNDFAFLGFTVETAKALDLTSMYTKSCKREAVGQLARFQPKANK